MKCVTSLCILLTLSVHLTALAQTNSVEKTEDYKGGAGHSIHGEQFDEGPRQAAYLMPGMGNLSFPVTTTDSLVQLLVNQGVAQLHGFWYYEAERSFRQAAVLDPECAICYWGMAMANINNRERARKFIADADQRKKNATRREQLFIEAAKKLFRDEDDKGKKIEKKERALDYSRDLEKIVEEFPDDIEAKAFLALQLWENERNDLPIVSRLAIDALLQQVFDVAPLHPAHHYRIHLWDSSKAERALESAAKCGLSLPGIAHAWHMPGHTYSKLHRYQDAVYQQEASARVDHAHMMRDRVMPDQIHNFAHNNEWLIRNLIKIGRVQDALSLAKNMLELPRHPKYNSLDKGSTKFGRERLLQTLTAYRLWPELIDLADTMYLEPTGDKELQIERLRHLGIALALTNANERRDKLQTELGDLLKQEKSELELLETKKKELDEAGKDKSATNKLSEADKKKTEANQSRRRKEIEKQLKTQKDVTKKAEEALAALDAATAASKEDWKQALSSYNNAGSWDELLKAEWLARDGSLDKSIEELDKQIREKQNEVLPLAVKSWVQYQADNLAGAEETMAVLRPLASQADLDTPLLARLNGLATELGFEEYWAADYRPALDLGERPDLNSLGPFRWSPYQAPNFQVTSSDQSTVNLPSLKGKPTIVIFYLGFGCLHCVEQLHALSPEVDKFREAGIDVIAISQENLESLTRGLANYQKAIEIPLHADQNLEAFKAFRCFDNFELQPLHGTFLLDHQGRVLWQDISYEPFMDVTFLMKESHRLLELAGFPNSLSREKQLTASSQAKN